MKNIKRFCFAAMAVAVSSSAIADQQILDDLIVDGSACVGQDCVNGESFGFDTLRLKENNLRMHFQDTSSSASFPTNDWRLVANDSSNGGANYFAIEDVDAGRQVFRVDAGAPASSLHVDSQGDVGIGTSSAVVELHVKDGDSPTLRLEQDGSSGFTPQTWDLAGNETNFFIRDVTNGSQLPFRIEPGADTNSIYIENDNDIGMGTNNPNAKLHVLGSGSPFAAQFADVFIQDNSATGDVAMLSLMSGATGNSQLTFGDSTDQFRAQIIYSASNNKFNFDIGGPTGRMLSINPDGSFDTLNGASLTAGGTWADASSRTLKDNIKMVSLDSALDTIMRLTPVSYHYKSNPTEGRLGFIAEDVPEQVAYNDGKRLSSMDIVAALTKVVQQQQQVIADMKAKIEELSPN